MRLWNWQVVRSIIRLSQATFGLIGFGKIGRLIWQRMQGFGCRGLVYDPYLPAETILSHGAAPVGPDELVQAADMIHIQSPLMPETYHLIGERQLSLLKPGDFLTNTARGPIIDEAALLAALRSAGLAASDWTTWRKSQPKSEAGSPTNPLIHLPNVIVTPHTAWYSEQAAEEVKRISASEVARVLSGLKPVYPVNNPEKGEN